MTMAHEVEETHQLLPLNDEGEAAHQGGPRRSPSSWRWIASSVAALSFVALLGVVGVVHVASNGGVPPSLARLGHQKSEYVYPSVDARFKIPEAVLEDMPDRSGIAAVSRLGVYMGFGVSPKKTAAVKHVGPVTTLNVPVYLLSVPGSMLDDAKTKITLQSLVDWNGKEAVKQFARVLPGIDPSKWPQHENLAAYTVKDLIGDGGMDRLAKLKWFDAFAKRDSMGRLSDYNNYNVWPLSHHLGCLFAHVFSWKLARDMQYKHTAIFESDGADPALLSVPLSAIGPVAAAAPKDYDVIFLTHRHNRGDLMKELKPDHHGNVVSIYKIADKNGEAGLSGYIISDRFRKKAFDFMSKDGGDMVDAWLSSMLCGSLSFDDQGNFQGWHQGSHKLLKCYQAESKGFKNEVDKKYPVVESDVVAGSQAHEHRIGDVVAGSPVAHLGVEYHSVPQNQQPQNLASNAMDLAL